MSDTFKIDADEHDPQVWRPDSKLDPLQPIRAAFQRIERSYEQIQQLGENSGQLHALSLSRWEKFQPTVRVVGAAGTGKTALLNAMLGRPDFLPLTDGCRSSVELTININHSRDQREVAAEFHFIDKEQWEDLVRAGELPDALPPKFLGTTTSLFECNPALFGRFLSSPVDAGPVRGSGAPTTLVQFVSEANISYESDLFPAKFVFREPHMDWTVPVRRAISRPVSNTDLCILVISVDEINEETTQKQFERLSYTGSETVIVFVSGIDRLVSPGEEVQRVSNRLKTMMSAADLPADTPLVFGSAEWASAALRGKCSELPMTSIEAMLAWAESDEGKSQLDQFNIPPDEAFIAWVLSGVPTVHGIIAQRMINGPFQRFEEEYNAVVQVLREKGIMNVPATQDDDVGAALEILDQLLTDLPHKTEAAFERHCKSALEELRVRLQRAEKNTSESAELAFLSHIDLYGKKVDWIYKASGMRLLFSSAYSQFSNELNRTIEACLTEAHQAVEEQAKSLGLEKRIPLPRIEPEQLKVTKPAEIGSSVEIKMRNGFWQRLLDLVLARRKSGNDYTGQIRTRISELALELNGDLITHYQAEAQQILMECLSNRVDALRNSISSVRDEICQQGSPSETKVGLSKNDAA